MQTHVVCVCEGADAFFEGDAYIPFFGGGGRDESGGSWVEKCMMEMVLDILILKGNFFLLIVKYLFI